jgi:DNA-binding transcriptional MerR regulator
MTVEQQDRVITERIVSAQPAPPAQPRVSGPASGRANEYFTLKAREKELTQQREDLEERREELTQQLNRSNGGVDRTGLEQRITTIDQRLQTIEIDLNQVGREAAQAAPASIAQPEPRIIYRGNSDDEVVGAGFLGAFVMLVFVSPVLYRAWRRRKAPPSFTPAGSPALGSERIDRMEQAIDSIAVEIERVSENQRFMTRLMTETQLAGTIAAVRGSAEAAKAAAEKASNA